MQHLCSVPLALVLFSLTSASAISLPVELSRNTIALNIPVNQSSPISPLPPGPPGLLVDSAWEVSRALNPLGVYVTAIKFMYGLSLQEWSRQVDLLESGLCIISLQPNYNIIISTSAEPPGTALTAGLVVRVLYDSVTDMATRQPGFYRVANHIKVNEKKIGKMFIVSSNLSLNDEDRSNRTSTAAFQRSIESSNIREGNTGNITQTFNFNEIIDPHDRRFKITWEWEAKNIPAQDIFSAALNGLAAVAQFDHDGPCEHITALSTSGNTVFHVGRSTRAILLGGIIARTFYLLINQLFLVQRRFEALWFYLSINGVNIGDGYIHKIERVGGDNATNQVASE